MDERELSPTLGQQWKGLQIIFGAIMTSHLMIIGVLYYVAQQQDAPRFGLLSPIGLALVMGFFGARAAAQWLPANLLKRAAAAPTVEEKLGRYRGAMIVRWAMGEGAVIMAMLAYILTGDWRCLVLAGFGFLASLASFPSARRAAAELDERAFASLGG